MRAVIAAVLACATMFSFTACANFKVIDDEEVFYDALDSALSIDEDETYHVKNAKVNGDKAEYVIYAKDGDNFYAYIRFKKEDDAMDYFDEFYDDFDTIKKDKEFSGSSSMSASKTKGVVLFNGDLEGGTELGFFRHNKNVTSDVEIYGGVYVNKNVYIEVYSVNGSKRDNVFIFNNQGLLTQSSIQGSKNIKTVVDYAYTYDEVLGYTLKQSKSKNVTINYAPIYGDHGRRECIKGSNGSRQEYTFNEKGQLTKLVITQPKAEKRTLIYQDGYVIREEKGAQVFRYHYDYDTATRKKFLIAIKELKGNDVVHERTFDYDIDTHGRYTRVAVALDGKHQMTITRSYSD